ncbi:MAG: glycosyltransferase family 1 protein [Candidatus Omnitrophota bacterium]|nr:glycosyltransferase family 1 protein [Candidatus Omnitrophota bacterium]
MRAKIKIGFYTMGGRSWYAGIRVMETLMKCLKKTFQDKIEILLLNDERQKEIPREFTENVNGAINVPEIKLPVKYSFNWWFDKMLSSGKTIEKNTYIANQLNSFLTQQGVDVIFSPLNIFKFRTIPVLSWVSDLQHMYLPEMFSREEIQWRTNRFRRTIEASGRIVTLSEAVKNNFVKFFKINPERVVVDSPVCYCDENIYKRDPYSMIKLYNLPEKFIYFPGTFWKHKNHEILFEAVAKLRKEGEKIIIVCSGYLNDYRHPHYFADVIRKLSIWGIREQVIHLGTIPYVHVLDLIRQSICVINPSLYEGFGITADEARTVGKQVLLSDLPSHHEQNIHEATFFDPRDIVNLEEKMVHVWNNTVPGPDKKLEKESQKELPERLEKRAVNFMTAIQELLK